ncbi:MAG: AraC family transcriptional regulator [Eubacteriales bacterium]|nr:AraC family transcriptional regulator [Eubacteriales bacterium]
MHPDSSLKENVTHGTIRKPITGIHFYTGPETPYPEYFFVGRHWHHTIEILYIAKGSFLLEINLEEYSLQEGDICFLNGEDLHQITGKVRDTRHEVLIFDPKILAFSYEDEFEEQVLAPFISRRQILPHVLRTSDVNYEILKPVILQLMKISYEQPSGWYVSCKLLLLRLIASMYEHNMLLPADEMLSASDKLKIDRYKKLVSYMEEHYSHPVSLQELADVISCNPQYLCRFFKEITGTSPVQYLIACRVEHACTLLEETTDPILDVSMDCGFDNVSYFIRKFRQLKGCTPKEYRSRCSKPHGSI